jgi:hypothetical protein
MWRWLLLWLVLLAASAGYLFLAFRRLWWQLRELGKEAERAAATLQALEAESQQLQEAGATAALELKVLAIFDDPVRLERERAAIRQALVQRRRAARAARYPRWARSVD